MKKITIFFSILLLCSFIFVGSSYAATSYPPVPSHGSDDIVIVYKNFNGDLCARVYYSANGYDTSRIKLYHALNSSNKDLIRLGVIGVDDYYYGFAQYNLDNNGEWYVFSDEVTQSSGGAIPYSEILFINTNVYADINSDEIFFPETPATLAEVLAEETQVTAEKIITTMKTLVLCGVGCLALLIGLVTFSKVFRRLGVR